VKRRLMAAAISVVAMVALAASPVLAFAGVTNGSFESGTFSGAPFDTLNAGSTDLEGWTIDSGSVDWIGSYWQAADGARSIDLDGNAAGAISQTLATTIGNTYDVTFALSGNPFGGAAAKTLTVGASGAASQSFTFDIGIAGNSSGDMKWATQVYSFVATSATTVLTFTSTTPGAFGPALDDISVAETAPPTEPPTEPPAATKAECMDGGWQTVVDAHGNGFKNQGDCVSYVATDGRNPGSLSLAPSSASVRTGDEESRMLSRSASVTSHASSGKSAASTHQSATHGKPKTDHSKSEHRGPRRP
jgi:choice-of-anchor C domain-containing protein